MKATIMLECAGREDDGFRFCGGVANTILDLERIAHTENYVGLIKYLDKVPKIFDEPCFNNNVIANTIYKIYEMGYITDVKYKYIAHFYTFHGRCGLCLKCEPK